MASVPVTGVVEGDVDEAILRRLITEAGGDLGVVHVTNGKSRLTRGLRGFNSAARHSPWVVLVDLDRDGDCAPPFVQAWLPSPAPHMCLRVAVREAEAWLLADAAGLAAFLGVPVSRIPGDPDSLDDPKRELVSIASRSRRIAIREDLVPRPSSGRTEGPAYTSRILEFVLGTWNPAVAAVGSDSLRRCRRRIRELIDADRLRG